MIKVSENLRYARDLLSKPHGWTQGVGARDKNGVPVHPISCEAVCYCAMGAIEAASWEKGRLCVGEYALMSKSLTQLQTVLLWDSVAGWNDAAERTQSEVVSAFNKAIARAESMDSEK